MISAAWTGFSGWCSLSNFARPSVSDSLALYGFLVVLVGVFI